MSSALEPFPVDSTALKSQDAGAYLLCVNTLMKNTIVRALARILEIATATKEGGEFQSFVDYIRITCDMLELHLQGDEMFFTSPSPSQRIKLVDVLGASCNPRTPELQGSVEELRRKTEEWREAPGTFHSQCLDLLTRVSSTMLEAMSEQLIAVRSDALKSALGNEELQSMIHANIAWIGGNSDITVLLP
ncbi:hypothetical protein V5O48_004250 [Marasmius crinis-equi]|uniref:Hemerythrin-like domain-containing protein n=1 Tax=Marasmius crinis-equi TaxID=585013 RepID=A0ABR3FQN0_9AGAR